MPEYYFENSVNIYFKVEAFLHFHVIFVSFYSYNRERIVFLKNIELLNWKDTFLESPVILAKQISDMQTTLIFQKTELGMCERTLPLLFLNLGGEMLYVLDQRLKAQVRF
jgi:hypothetical protein